MYPKFQAIQNTDKAFLAVGLLEQMPMSLSVLEHQLPRIFAGAVMTFNKMSHQGGTKHRSSHPSISEENRRIMAGRMKGEYVFHKYVKYKLEKTYADMIDRKKT